VLGPLSADGARYSDFTDAAECFKKAADLNDADGVNCFGCCLERGHGVDRDIERAVAHYRRAASLGHSDALFNLGRCLECGKGIGRDLDRAAKCYRSSAAKGNAAAENSFGIFLERGIGVRKNLFLAAQFYRRAADHGDADGANNFGFCLEHGRGVPQNVAMAASYYKFADDRGHPEAKLNRARCLRLLDRWEPPDRSSESLSNPPSPNHLFELFRDLRENPDPLNGDEQRLLLALERLKSAAISPAPAAAVVSDAIGRGDSSIVKLTVDLRSNFIAVKTAKDRECAKLIRREAVILKALEHPLVIGVAGRSDSADGAAAVVTELAGNGALVAHLPPACDSQSRLSGETRIAKIITGVALAMRFVHSRGAIHRDLTPANILLDWDWAVRIADFGRSDFPATADSSKVPPIIDCRYLAPECYERRFLDASDVFAFGLILFELVVGRPAFSKGSRTGLDLGIAKRVSVEGERPKIPDSVLPITGELITDCWAASPDDRPTFAAIVRRLVEMDFKITANVKSAKIRKFVNKIEEWERENVHECPAG
jgi:TPR repeat protein